MATGIEAQGSEHIQKEGTCQSILTRRGSVHIDNCNTGFNQAATGVSPKGVWEAHHIMCISSMQQRQSVGRANETEQWLEDCLWVSKWDINDAHNMTGLPINSEFRTNGISRANKWVSHSVDHNSKNGYTEEVTGYLQREVFDSLKRERSKGEHSFTAADISEELKGVSDEYRDILDERANDRVVSLKEGWEKRFEKSHERIWYHPFSMAKFPNHRYPGVSLKNLTGVLKMLK